MFRDISSERKCEAIRSEVSELLEAYYAIQDRELRLKLLILIEAIAEGAAVPLSLCAH